MKQYLVTGYSKKDGKMATHVYSSIEDVAELINMCEKGLSNVGEAIDMIIVKNAKDLDFDVQSRASHSSAQIIKTPKYCWSIFFIK